MGFLLFATTVCMCRDDAAAHTVCWFLWVGMLVYVPSAHTPTTNLEYHRLLPSLFIGTRVQCTGSLYTLEYTL